jgi:hypothetical protein
MYKIAAGPTSPPPTPRPLTLPRRSGEILPVTTPIETLPTRITRQEQPEQTVVSFPMSAGDHFFAMAGSQKVLEAAGQSPAADIEGKISSLQIAVE